MVLLCVFSGPFVVPWKLKTHKKALLRNNKKAMALWASRSNKTIKKRWVAWRLQVGPGTPEPSGATFIRKSDEILVRKWGVSRIEEI